MNFDYWPIQPTFISDFKRKRECNGEESHDAELRHPNIEGLLKVDELRGYLADASDDKEINNPLSLFQVVPQDFVIEDNRRIKEIFPNSAFVKQILNGKRIIRIDPGRLFSNFHCCDLFRKCNNGGNESLCYESDSRIALLYHPNLLSINIDSEFSKYYKTLCAIIDEYNKFEGLGQGLMSLRVVKYDSKKEKESNAKYHKRTRFFITYKCKFSHLEEYFFPIIFAGRVVAVLMQGQRFSEGTNKNDLFSGHIESSLQGQKLRHSIDNLAKRYFKDPPMTDKRLGAITRRVENLEKKIAEEIFVASQSYVNVSFSNWQKKFRNKIKEIDSNEEDALRKYNQYLSGILKEIFDEFHENGFIRIYTIQNSEEYDDNQGKYKFVLVGDSSNTNSSKYNSLFFSSFPIKQDAIEKEELLKFIKRIPDGFNKETDVFRMEVPIMSQKAYIIWKRYDRTYEGELERHDKYYRDNLKSMYPTLLEPYFILEGAKLEKKLEASMRISVHESAQVIPSVIQAINSGESLDILIHGKSYNGNPTITKPMHKILDASNRLLLLEGLFRRSTLIFKKEPPRYQWHDFHRIIYSTKSLFDNSIYRKKSQALHVISDSKFSKYQLYTDYAYLSHALFNLIDNATKYGRKGSNIYLKIVFEYDDLLKRVLNKEKISRLKISVISYGNEIPSSVRKDIYKLYYRHSSNEVEGMGIGLFLVKKICNILEYDIECLESVYLSDLNLPLQYCYCKQTDMVKSILPEKYKQLLNIVCSKELEERIINRNAADNWEVTESEVKELLKMPIFENVFQITIPVEMNKNFKEI